MDTSVIMLIVGIVVFGGFITLIILVTLALLKFLRSKTIRQEKTVIRKSLGDTLKEHRIKCKMTQEFVAESLNVSRQAVSKWENGTSDPSTSHLLLLAKLFGISAEELLREVSTVESNDVSVYKEEM